MFTVRSFRRNDGIGCRLPFSCCTSVKVLGLHFPTFLLLFHLSYNSMKAFSKTNFHFVCLCGSSLAGIIRRQFIIQYSDIFFIIFCDDDNFQFLLESHTPTKRGILPWFGNTVLNHLAILSELALMSNFDWLAKESPLVESYS